MKEKQREREHLERSLRAGFGIAGVTFTDSSCLQEVSKVVACPIKETNKSIMIKDLKIASCCNLYCRLGRNRIICVLLY